jgi:hypothetical protein
MRRILILFFILTAALVSIGRPTTIFAQSDQSGTIIRLNVHNCNNDGRCQAQYGENYPACPFDCTRTQTDVIPFTETPTTSFTCYDSDIINSTIKITFNSYGTAIISWQTCGESIDGLSWGRTVDTEIGIISEINFNIQHSVEIPNLEPNTLYFYSIESVDNHGHLSRLNDLYFITPNIVKVFPPPTTSTSSASSLPRSPTKISTSTATSITHPLVPPTVVLKSECGIFIYYCADYYVAYFFGFINYLIWILYLIVIHM